LPNRLRIDCESNPESIFISLVLKNVQDEKLVLVLIFYLALLVECETQSVATSSPLELILLVGGSADALAIPVRGRWRCRGNMESGSGSC
jgi:hypothetical protein